MNPSNSNRRSFVKNSIFALSATTILPSSKSSVNQPIDFSQDRSLNFVGPIDGYTEHIGTLVSMMNWMRNTILRPVLGMSASDLDYLHDENSNTIGAMLWHLAATEKFYQLNTFKGMAWGSWDEKEYADWNVAMNLGDEGRKKIKGKPLEFYLDLLRETREDTLEEFKNLDDEWLLKVDPNWGWSGETNNYCKWFHVVEHESNHNGQFKYIKSRIS